jgi:hypothetical protein
MTFFFSYFSSNERKLLGLEFFEIGIEEDENFLVSLAFIEVIHIELANKAFKLGVPKVYREYFGL